MKNWEEQKNKGRREEDKINLNAWFKVAGGDDVSALKIVEESFGRGWNQKRMNEVGSCLKKLEIHAE